MMFRRSASMAGGGGGESGIIAGRSHAEWSTPRGMRQTAQKRSGHSTLHIR